VSVARRNLKAAAYDQLQMKDSAIQIYTDAIRQMKAYNYNKVAAGFAGLLAFELLKKGKTDNVKTLLEEYECHSGYFINKSEIEIGREIYYYWKGP